MIWPNENALTPASLATDGDQGERAKAGGPCDAQDTRDGVATLFLARVAMDAAQAQLDRYAGVTDTPMSCVVDAADLLDAARVALDGLP